MVTAFPPCFRTVKMGAPGRTTPRANGEEALREPRKMRLELPVLLCSGHVRPDAAERLRGAGVPVIEKPYVAAEFLGAMAPQLRS